MRGIRLRQGFAAVVVGCALAGCGTGNAPTPPEMALDNLPLEERPPALFTGPSRGRLQVGETFPSLRCIGWFNGEPRPVGPNGPKLHVIDIWSVWCPECERFAATLAEIKTKYASRGVQFISVTDMPKSVVERYNRVGAIDWPSGYCLAVESIDELGVVNKGMASMTRGYNIGPTIYVVGADGKVVGSDESGRWGHRTRAEIVATLEAAIEAGLAEPKGK